MSLKNVVIIGAAGNLGPAVLNAFLKESSFNVTVLSREGSKSTFPSGVKVVRADFESVDSLKEAFKGQDAVISLIAGVALGDQNKLIDAAIAAGVKRFLPSEFGSNVPDKRTRDIVPVFEAKFQTVNYLKSKEDVISWTSIINGPFFDWGLKVGFLGFQGASKSATIYDDGNVKFTGTNLHTVGLAVVKSLEKADLTKNSYVYVSSFKVSQNEILAIAEKATGSKWTITNQTTEEIIKDGREKVAKGDFSGIGSLIVGSVYHPDALGDFSGEGLWNEKLGLPQESLEESVKVAIQGKLVNEA